MRKLFFPDADQQEPKTVIRDTAKSLCFVPEIKRCLVVTEFGSMARRVPTSINSPSNGHVRYLDFVFQFFLVHVSKNQVVSHVWQDSKYSCSITSSCEPHWGPWIQGSQAET